MTVRRLRAKQRGPWCSYCEDKVRAVHRGCSFTRFACSLHLEDLEVEDKKQQDYDSYQTEGEYQALRNY